MNTFMYEHPLTNEHVRIVRDVVGYHVVGPIGKTLACGDVGAYLYPPGYRALYNTNRSGLGAMTEWSDIVEVVVKKFSLSRPENIGRSQPDALSNDIR